MPWDAGWSGTLLRLRVWSGAEGSTCRLEAHGDRVLSLTSA